MDQTASNLPAATGTAPGPRGVRGREEETLRLDSAAAAPSSASTLAEVASGSEDGTVRLWAVLYDADRDAFSLKQRVVIKVPSAPGGGAASRNRRTSATVDFFMTVCLQCRRRELSDHDPVALHGDHADARTGRNPTAFGNDIHPLAPEERETGRAQVG